MPRVEGNLSDFNHRLVLRNATVMSMDPDVGDFANADVLVEGSKIRAVGPHLQTDAPTLDCTGRIIVPGFVNSHHHTFQTALRGYWADALASDYFTQSREGETAVFHVYEPEDVYWGQYAGALEQLNAGTTTLVDTSQCTDTPAHTDAAIDGLTASGLRSVFAYSPRARGSSPSPEYGFPSDVHRLRAKYFSSPGQLVTPAIGSPVDADTWRMARELDLSLFTHVNDAAAGRQVEELSSYGLVGPWNTFIHCTGLAQTTWDTIADTGAKVSLSNLVEQTLSTGMPGLQEALDRDVRPSFSTDAVSLGPADFFSQMRTAFALQRSRLQESALRGEAPIGTAVTPREILQMATIEGARAAHMEDKVGSLTPGKEADILVLNAQSLNAAPVHDVAGSIVLLMDTSNVETVVVGGRIVKQSGELVGVDVGAVVSALQRSADGLLTRSASKNVRFTSCRA